MAWKLMLIVAAPAVALVALAAPAAALDFDMTVSADGTVTFDTGREYVTVERADPDVNLTLKVVVPQDRITGAVTLSGFFDVERPKQALAKTNGRYFNEFFSDDIGKAEGSGAFLNVTGAAAAPRLLFSLELGEQTLTIEKDTAPPRFTVQDPTNLRENGFVVVTLTDEPALGTLFIAPTDGSRAPVPYPTPSPAQRQNYPVIGLQPETPYRYWFVFRDFSGNAAGSAPLDITTPPKPFIAAPVVGARTPADGAVLTVAPDALSATIESPNGEIPKSGIRLFVDKTEVTEAIAWDGKVLVFTPATPFRVGMHTVGLEVTDAAGGEVVDRWKFEVKAATPMAAWLAVAALAAVGVLMRSRGPASRS